jgi:hypothetical protein
VKRAILILSALSVLLFAGCGQKAATSVDVQKDLEKAVASGGALSATQPEVKMYVEQAVTAVKNDDQAGAVLSLRNARSSGQMTPEQASSVDDMMAKARGVLVDRAMRGDQRAAMQLQMLNQNAPR